MPRKVNEGLTMFQGAVLQALMDMERICKKDESEVLYLQGRGIKIKLELEQIADYHNKALKAMADNGWLLRRLNPVSRGYEYALTKAGRDHLNAKTQEACRFANVYDAPFFGYDNAR